MCVPESRIMMWLDFLILYDYTQRLLRHNTFGLAYMWSACLHLSSIYSMACDFIRSMHVSDVHDGIRAFLLQSTQAYVD